MMQKLFSQELRFKDAQGDDFPEWEEKPLGDVCKLQGGYAFKSSEFKKNGIPIVRISNISNHTNYIQKSGMVFYDKLENAKKFEIKYGDLLLAMSEATTGKSSIYNLHYSAYLNQRVGIFRAQKTLVQGFLNQFVFSNLFYRQLDAVLVAGAQPNISSKDIESFRLNLPSLEEQQKIADFLSSIDRKIDLISTELDHAKSFKKGLLQQMFI